MSLLLAAMVVVGFAGILHALNLTGYAWETSRRARACADVLQDSSMSDDEKEAALQDHARRLFVLLGILGGGSVLALGVPLGLIWLLDQGGLASFPGVLSMLERADFLLGTVVLGMLGYLLTRSFGQS